MKRKKKGLVHIWLVFLIGMIVLNDCGDAAARRQSNTTAAGQDAGVRRDLSRRVKHTTNVAVNSELFFWQGDENKKNRLVKPDFLRFGTFLGLEFTTPNVNRDILD
ncbi:hypothetical protein ACJX0J_021655 [Zea mays]